MNDKFVEPFGHFSRMSKLERVWSQRSPACCIRRKRVQSFDPLSGTSFAPMQYWFESIDYSQVSTCPDEAWIDEAFLAFVKGEFKSNEDRPEIPIFPTVVGTNFIDHDVYREYMISCERQMLYAYYKRSSRHTEQDLVENVKNLLADAELGNKQNRRFAPFAKLGQMIDEWARAEARLLCVLPSFPFKDQSYLRTGEAAPDEFDLGEIALLIRLHLLSLAFYQFHPWGVDWLIAADGNYYADMFGISRANANSYFERLRTERASLNITGTISILDLEEIISHYKAGCEDMYERDREAIFDRVSRIASSDDGPLGEAFAVLKRGMRQNQSTREFENDVSREELWKICNWEALEPEPQNLTKELHAAIGVRAADIAVSYATENIMLRRHNVLEKVFPDTIRTTIHAKPGQVAVPQVGTCFPWNGVAIHPGSQEIDAKSLEVVRYYEIARRAKEVTANVDRKTGTTLFYSF